MSSPKLYGNKHLPPWKPSTINEGPKSFHSGGDCRCTKPLPSLRTYLGYRACEVCGHLFRQRER